jgi:hypothetical protein
MILVFDFDFDPMVRFGSHNTGEKTEASEWFKYIINKLGLNIIINL